MENNVLVLSWFYILIQLCVLLTPAFKFELPKPTNIYWLLPVLQIVALVIAGFLY